MTHATHADAVIPMTPDEYARLHTRIAELEAERNGYAQADAAHRRELEVARVELAQALAQRDEALRRLKSDHAAIADELRWAREFGEKLPEPSRAVVAIINKADAAERRYEVANAERDVARREAEVMGADCRGEDDTCGACARCVTECLDARDHANRRADAAESALAESRATVETLRGLKPELPPFPPSGSGMPRYGLRWNGPTQPLAVPMDDGYWTPAHLAFATVETLRAELADLRARERLADAGAQAEVDALKATCAALEEQVRAQSKFIDEHNESECAAMAAERDAARREADEARALHDDALRQVVLHSGAATRLEAERDEARAHCERFVELLKRVQHLADDADQGPRGATGDGEWRIPWTRYAVEVFADVAKLLAVTPAASLAEREARLLDEAARRVRARVTDSDNEMEELEIIADRAAGAVLTIPPATPDGKETARD